MVMYMAPDVYVEEVSGGARPIEAVGTSNAGFLGVAPDPRAHFNEAVDIGNWTRFVQEFIPEATAESTQLSNAVFAFFQNGGSRCYVVNVGQGQPIAGGGRERTGLDLLEPLNVQIVAAPGYTDPASYDALLSHCERLGDRVAILDAPRDVAELNRLTEVATIEGGQPESPSRRGVTPSRGEGDAAAGSSAETGSDTPPDDADSIPGASATGIEGRGLRGRQSDGGYGAYYFPWIMGRDPLVPNNLVVMPPSGYMAGIWARNDGTRGVHKAPANEIIRGALGVTHLLTRAELGELNQAGVNCIRAFPTEGIRVWGARTLAGSSSEWRYLSVRRLFNMVKESIAGGTRWIVFEPNDYTLWKSIIRDISAFLIGLWRNGALMGRTPEEAFFVKCDAETNPPDVINRGMVVTIVGLAPVKPAEFVVFRISQWDSGTEIEVRGAA